MNVALKNKRKDPNVLFAGDVVFVPEREIREESCATDGSHKFVRKGVPAKLRLQLRGGDGQPRPDVHYTLVIDGKSVDGSTDSDGWIEETIPPVAERGELLLRSGEVYKLRLGHLDPVEELTGVQARLKALGYYAGPSDGQMTQQLKDSLRAYQKARGMADTGLSDAAVQAALKSDYGS